MPATTPTALGVTASPSPNNNITITMSMGSVIGIVILGAAVAFSIITGIIFIIYYRRNRKAKKEEAAQEMDERAQKKQEDLEKGDAAEEYPKNRSRTPSLSVQLPPYNKAPRLDVSVDTSSLRNRSPVSPNVDSGLPVAAPTSK